MLAVATIVAAIAVTGIAAMATPVFAGGHHHNGIKVNQSIDQTNACPPPPPVWIADESQSTICVNDGSNNADIQR
jgi:hypothetical protein